MAKSYLFSKERSFLKGRDLSRVNYIRLLVEEELMADREDFSLCKNETYTFYLHKYDILSSDARVLDATEIEAFEIRFEKLKLKEGVISPQEFSLKDSITSVIKSHIPERRKEKLLNDEAVRWGKISLVLLSIVTVFYVISWVLKPTFATITIQSNISIKRVLLNGNVQYTVNNSISNLDTGVYEIMLLSSDEKSFSKKIHIQEFKTYYARIFQEPNLTKKRVLTGLKISTNESNFIIKVDSVSYLSSDIISLEAGTHTVRVEKEGFFAEPAFRSVFLSRGETLTVPFTFVEQTKKIIKKRSKIVVKTNQLDADIFINGKKVSSSGSFSLRNIIAGTYRIQALKKGYWSTPSEKIVRIKKADQSVNISFKLKKNSGNISIYTLNQQGTIFLNENVYGKGQVSKLIPTGSYTVSFSDIIGFYTPKPEKITIEIGKKETIIGTYLPIIHYSGTFNVNGFNSSKIHINTGFVKNLTFSPNPTRKIDYTPSGAILSYPNDYNNPVAGHAITLEFDLPNTFNNSQNISLFLSIAKGEKTYSISNKINAEISLFVNNRRKFMNYTINENELKFSLTELLLQGKNEILIFLTDNNNIPITIKSIEIKK